MSSYSYVGIFFGVSVAICLYAGYWLDERFHTKPWFSLCGVLLGVATGLPGLTLVLFNFKLLILAALIFVAVGYLHVAPVPFVIGISVLPVAIFIVAIRHHLTPSNETPRPHDNEETHG
jgi:hypothetical protein